MFRRSPESRRRRRWRQARERASAAWFVHPPTSVAAQPSRALSPWARERVFPAWVLPARVVPWKIAVRQAIAPRAAHFQKAPPWSAVAARPSQAPSRRARERVFPAWVLPARAIPRKIAVCEAIAPRAARLWTAPPLAISLRP